MSNALFELFAAVSARANGSAYGSQSIARAELEQELAAVGTSIAQLASGNIPAGVNTMQIYDAIVRVCTKHGISIDMEEDPQWDQLHGRLAESLERFGTNNPGHSGDFWLVEDYFGTNEFKLVIIRAGVLTKALVQAIQEVLAGATRKYKVAVFVDDPQRGEYMALEICSDQVLQRDTEKKNRNGD